MDEDWRVACLCAAWCTTCDAYRPVLAAVARAHPGLHFAWIDIEDDADTLGDDALDISAFPTLMVLRGGQALFHGPLLPHAATLWRLLDTLRAQPGALAGAAAVPPGMAVAVWRLAPQRPLTPAD